MLPILQAVAPVFGLILVGWALRFREFPAPGFWPASERLTYYVLFPAMLVQGLSGRELGDGALPLAATIFSSVVLVALVLHLVWRRFGVSGPVYSSVFQGAIRPNTYVGLSLAAALLGPDWMRLSAVVLLVIIPTVNVLCVLVLARHGDNGVPTFLGTVRQLVSNPLILSCVVGMALNWFGVRLPGILNDMLYIFGRAALPMGLLAVGAGLQVRGCGSYLRPACIASVAHLVVLPVVAWGLSHLFGAGADARMAAVIFTAIPVSVSSFILARQMGGDHDAMAFIITFQTALAAFTLPVMLVIFGG